MKTRATKNILSAQKANRIAKAKASFLTALMTAYADNGENQAPEGIGGTSTMTTTINIVFWAVRIIIIIIASPGVIKIVQGQADENPRDRNAGIATVAVAGVCFAASFAIQNLI